MRRNGKTRLQCQVKGKDDDHNSGKEREDDRPAGWLHLKK